MGRVFATTDWHGNWAVAQKVFDFLQPDDILYYLGDATDRGENGVKILQAMMNNPRIFYIKGNHDEFVELGIEKINYEEDECNGASDLPIRREAERFDLIWWETMNGGKWTHSDLWKLTKVKRMKIHAYIANAATEVRYPSKKGTIILEHAGYTPGRKEKNKWGKGHDPLWDREHFEQKWNEEEYPHTYVVHGHTPVQYLKWDFGYIDKPPLTQKDMIYKRQFAYDEPTDYRPTILHYCNGHKIDLDMCTITSNRVALLDLDTFEEYYFDGEDTPRNKEELI